jgi:hypothetical protein
VDTEVELIYGKDFVKLRRRGFTSGPSNEDRVLDALAGGPISHRALTDVLNAEGDPISEVMVRITVRTLVGEGKVLVDGMGRVTLRGS